ncbi:MAG TPA: ATP-dependent DNA ligase [Mycobacterium sp.]|nr:ATP-dependent DNA ligase [Mycobacterium sp.]HQC78226.1 ATP-dependent DNA ligase [Mycobacterium sp.]
MIEVWPPGATTGPVVTLTNAGKVLYPATGTTKADVFRYYTAIAEVMLPHIAGRPATRKRWPDGVGSPAFFEKGLASSAPDWLHRGVLAHRSGDTVYPIIDTPIGLAWIAQQAALELHVPQWRFGADGKPGPANRLVFDLDPGEGVTMAQMCEVAHAVRELMDDIGLTVYPVTSGSKGLHLYASLADPVSSSGAAVLARKVAQQLEQSMPTLVTATMARSLRAGKIFLDWSQNNAAKTTIAPYSMRGREAPTVAAPRTWDELSDAGLRQVRYDEVLARVAEQGDLLAGLDGVPDRLRTYRGKRDAAKTPEPLPSAAPRPMTPGSGNGDRFVIQEHRARRLHYDFRLERDGVLVSWAVPKNLPDKPAVNHLAVHTEDHPLEYATFEGTIPKGEYGAGKVVVWDTGTYTAEKFNVSGDSGGEVIVDLAGQRISGRYVLIQTDGDQWLAHRMKEQPGARLQDFEPMLATLGSVDKLTAAHYSFEGKYDGYRMLLEADHGRLRLQSRNGRDVTAEYPQLQPLAEALAEHHVILDGEAVALDEHGVPNFAQMQNRARASRIQFWAFDILELDGRSLLRAKYRDRRQILETFAEGTPLIVPGLLDGDGPTALAESRKRKWEGIVAKRWDSTYQPGRRSASWIKDKNWNTQEAVIGGWREGNGGRSSGIGALLLGVPSEGGLRFIGRVGTGFTEKELAGLKSILAPLHTTESPFRPALPRVEARGVTYVRPELVGEVRYGEMTSDGHLRHPSWRGLRPDKDPGDVILEPPV